MKFEKKKDTSSERFSLDKMHTALLVAVYPSGGDKKEHEDLLEELSSLAQTYGLETKQKVFCPVKEFSAKTYIGEGKAKEIGEIAEKNAIDVVIFDDEVTPNQEKNLEAIIQRPVLTRSALILEVFHLRAKTKEAMLQVELAKNQYQLPRLKRLWTHLSRQKTAGSGKGPLRGEGEKQIEVDRRIIKERVHSLQKEIKSIEKQRSLERKARLKSKIVTFGIVGYTNAGKSTLLNALTDAKVYVEDKLFATLDTTTRKFTLPNHENVLLVDTVGFIRKLPHLLIASFKSTLEEALHTDILLHVVDVSDPKAEIYIHETNRVLEEIGVTGKAMIYVLNKADKVQNTIHFKKLQSKYQPSVLISAKTQEGFDALFQQMQHATSKLRITIPLRIPQGEYAVVHKILEEGRILSTEYEENDILLKVEISLRLADRLKKYYERASTA